MENNKSMIIFTPENGMKKRREYIKSGQIQTG